MPVKPTYPGVYIEEIPSGVRSIIGVSTSIAAFVDGFARGPRDHPVQLFGLADFERELGGLHKDSPASYAIQQFFLNGGTECWVVRVGHNGITASSGDLLDQTSPGAATLAIKAGRRIRDASVDDPGLWGDALHLEVDYDTADPSTLFNLSVAEIVESGGRRVTLRSESFRNLGNVKGSARDAVAVVNEGSRLVQLTAASGWALPGATGTYGTAHTADIATSAYTVQVDVRPTGSGAASSVNVAVTLAGPTSPPAAAPLLQTAIRTAGANPALPEPIAALLTGATVKSIRTKPGEWRLHVLAGRGGRSFDPRATLTLVGAGAAAFKLDTALVRPQLVKLTGGGDGTMPITDPIALIGTATTGLHALDEVDLVNVLCIPRAGDLPASQMQQVYMAAEAYVEQRRAFLLVDVPEFVRDLAGMQAWIGQNETLRHKNAAVYFPRTRIPDPLADGRPRSIGASGTIAGLYTRTDTERGVWKAPAGTDARLRNVQALDAVLTDPQNGALNPLGINCLRSFPVYSNICWGARTLDGADSQASEWKYVPVRRLTLFLEESLYRGTKWVVFEPNDEPLWAQIRLNVGAFMHTLFRQGAFQGTSPREAYLVKCDRETNPQADIDAGIVNILVGFAPLKPAEFVIIRIQQLAGELQV
jgi:phage tail sheath protein FI